MYNNLIRRTLLICIVLSTTTFAWEEKSDSLLSPYGLYIGAFGSLSTGGAIITIHPLRRLATELSIETAWDRSFFGGAVSCSYYAILTKHYAISLSTAGQFSYFPMDTVINNYPIEKGAELFTVSPAVGIEYFFPKERVVLRLDLGYIFGERDVPYKSVSLLNDETVTVYTYHLERNPLRVALSARFRIAGHPRTQK